MNGTARRAAVIAGVLAMTTAATPAAQAGKKEQEGRGQAPLVIAHRGASAYRPEHTLAAYRLAIDMGADYIEPDLVSTKDGVLVARHENEIGGTTDVAQHPEFADRRTTKVDRRHAADRLVHRGLHARRAQDAARERADPAAAAGEHGVRRRCTRSRPCRRSSTSPRREGVGIYPETKHPTYFDSIGLSLEEPLVATLRANGLDRPTPKVFIQSFEVSNLQAARRASSACRWSS